ncbi:MAG: hypothetical protein QOJ40_671, partial [Verrucomicrobiota bacterium]
EDTLVKTLDPKAVGWFDLESLPIMQQARRNRLATAQTGFNMGIPFNELNRILDLGFKPLPWGNDGYIPSQFQKLGTTSAAGVLPAKSSAGILPAGNGGILPPDPSVPTSCNPCNPFNSSNPIAQMSHLLTRLSPEVK